MFITRCVTRYVGIFTSPICVLMLMTCGIIIPTMSYGYMITDKVEDLVLIEDDIPGFRLKSQVPSQWLISEQKTVKGIRQTWTSNTYYGREIIADVCLLGNTKLCNKCAHFTRMGTSGILSWGSYKGQFLGDKLWMGTNAFGNATFLFVKYNAAVRVGMVKCEHEQMELMEDVAQKILKKIDYKKSRKPIDEYTKLKMEQISEELFEKIISGAVDSVLIGFKIERKGHALWLTDKDGHYQFGRQWEWRGEGDILIGISICRFQNPDEAQKGAEVRRLETYGYFIKGDLGKPEIPKDINRFESVASVLFAKGSMVVHIYQYNKKEIDTGLFESLVAKLSPNL
ncbi:MAG: hypothetical protein ACFFCW_25375 [Candidatus Hodarchaeota archaeon]